jgi:hypothetical protein
MNLGLRDPGAGRPAPPASARLRLAARGLPGLFACAVALGCLSPVSRVELYPETAQRGPIAKVVLLPLELPSANRVSSARDTVDPAAAELVTARVLEALVQSGRFTVIPPGDVRLAIAELGERVSIQQLREKVVSSFKPDALLLGRVRRFDERDGGERPAAVSFDLELRATDGALLWTGSYDETQRSLSEDLGSLGRASERGFRWVSADALASFGARELVRQLPQSGVGAR